MNCLIGGEGALLPLLHCGGCMLRGVGFSGLHCASCFQVMMKYFCVYLNILRHTEKEEKRTKGNILYSFISFD